MGRRSFVTMALRTVGLAVGLGGGLAVGPVAAQPYSQSMAQCAGLYEAVGTLVTKAGRTAKLAAAAAAFSRAALAEAEAEGQDDPEGWVARHRAAMRADWEARGKMVAFSEEYRDWTGSCVTFARDRGIAVRFD